MNAQSIVNKTHILKAHICDSQPELIAVTETWTHGDISDALLKLDGYHIVARVDRTDTKKGRGGGVLIYSRLSNISANISMSKFSQHVSVTVNTSGKHEPDIHIHLVYRSPNSPHANNEELLKYLKNVPVNSVIVGDFNFPEIDWNTLTTSGKEDSDSFKFLQAGQDTFLSQIVDFPTNFTPQKNGSITTTCIDLVLTDNINLIASVQPIGQLGKSTHAIINCELVIPTSKNETTQLVPDYSKCDFKSIKAKIAEINWHDELKNENADNSWKIFREKLETTVFDCIPKKIRRFSSRPLWMNQNVMRIIRKKRRQWKWYSTTKDYAAYQAHKQTANLVRKAVRNAKRNLERKLAKDSKSNPKPFYRYMNTSTKTQAKVGPLKDEKGQLHTDEPAMVEILNSTFTSVFTSEDLNNLPTPADHYSGNSPLASLEITESMVQEKVNKLDPNKSPGPDSIHPTVLKQLAEELTLPLAIIFNRSLHEGVVPKDWRIANVTSIFKKGDRTQANNYRPISLTSIICRIMESLLRDAIVAHLKRHNLIRKSQHGFMSHKSCLTNLLEFLEEVTKLLDEGHNVDIVFLDFARAFDKVPHSRLMMKVRAHGITGDIAYWIEKWLSNREQRTVLNGCHSSWSKVSSGVPQGSVIGPLLFIIYINDIDYAIDALTVIKKFADDTKICRHVDNTTDRDQLQHQLDNLFHWSREWQMLFNLDKCVVMHLGSSNMGCEYTMCGEVLKTTETEKDLGVYLNKSMKPSVQVAEAVKKANQVLGQLLRAVTYRDKVYFVKLYKQRVRCHLEFCVQAWCPWLQKDIDLLESVQKRAIRNVCGLKGTYDEKLTQLGLTPLVERRVRGDMLQTYKIMNGVDDVDHRTWFNPASDRTDQPTRSTSRITDEGHVTSTKNISVPQARLELRKQFFSHRVTHNWNSLPHYIQTASTINQFKLHYDKYMCQ